MSVQCGVKEKMQVIQYFKKIMHMQMKHKLGGNGPVCIFVLIY